MSNNINIKDRERTPYSANGFQYGWHVYDALYGPWNSFRELVVSINPSLSSNTDEQIENYLKTRPVGLTVGIYENDKVVEYWNPVEGQGFVKKSSTINVSSYEEALTYVINEENAGKIIVIPDKDGDSDNESGVYVISENGELVKLGEDRYEHTYQRSIGATA